MNLILALIAAYLLGSLSFAVITSRLMGLADPRSYGSGNPGATNVLRSGSKAAAILTLVLDALKGYLPVLAVSLWGEPLGLAGFGVAAGVGVGLAAFVGHLWPVFFRFQGGKGVATAVGVVFGLNPLLGLAVLASFALLLVFSRYVSLASMVAAVFAAFYQLLIWGWSAAVAGLAVMAALLIWRHRANIERLLKGSEAKLGAKKHV